jgi:hypothetical protein
VARVVRRWTRVRALTPDEKAEIAAACETLIATQLKPRLLPVIRPTPFNYPVDMLGRWRGRRYSFIRRYRSGFADNAGEEFDMPYARLDHVEEALDVLRFDVMWLRHTGTWWRLHAALPLDQALHRVETEPVFQVI